MDKPIRYKDLRPEERTRAEWLRSTIWSFERLVGKYERGESQEEYLSKCPLCEMFKYPSSLELSRCTDCPNSTHKTWNCRGGIPSGHIAAVLKGNNAAVRLERLTYIKEQLPLLKAELFDLLNGEQGTKEKEEEHLWKVNDWCLVVNNKELNERCKDWKEVVVGAVLGSSLRIHKPGTSQYVSKRDVIPIPTPKFEVGKWYMLRGRKFQVTDMRYEQHGGWWIFTYTQDGDRDNQFDADSLRGTHSVECSPPKPRANPGAMTAGKSSRNPVVESMSEWRIGSNMRERVAAVWVAKEMK